MHLEQFLTHENILRLSLVLLHSLWQVALVGFVIAVALRCLTRRSAGLRYGATICGLWLTLILPAFTWCILDLPTDETTPVAVATELETHSENVPSIPQPITTDPISLDEVDGYWAPGDEISRNEITPTPLAEDFVLSEATTPSESGAQSTLPRLVVAFWLFGVTLISIRLCMGFAWTIWILRTREPLTPELQARICVLQKSMQWRKLPRVFLSERIEEAIVVGYLRPLVLVPVCWTTQLPVEAIEAVIVHELTHIRRFDLWAILLQRLAEAVLFYHPVLWWLSRRISYERELSCDAESSAVLKSKVVYAQALQQIAEFTFTNSLKGHRRSWLTYTLSPTLGGPKMELLSRVQQVLTLPESSLSSAVVRRQWGAALLFSPLLILALGVTLLSADELQEKSTSPVISEKTAPKPASVDQQADEEAPSSGRILFGTGINSDAGLAGQLNLRDLTIDGDVLFGAGINSDAGVVGQLVFNQQESDDIVPWQSDEVVARVNEEEITVADLLLTYRKILDRHPERSPKSLRQTQEKLMRKELPRQIDQMLLEQACRKDIPEQQMKNLEENAAQAHADEIKNATDCNDEEKLLLKEAGIQQVIAQSYLGFVLNRDQDELNRRFPDDRKAQVEHIMSGLREAAEIEILLEDQPQISQQKSANVQLVANQDTEQTSEHASAKPATPWQADDAVATVDGKRITAGEVLAPFQKRLNSLRHWGPEKLRQTQDTLLRRELADHVDRILIVNEFEKTTHADDLEQIEEKIEELCKEELANLRKAFGVETDGELDAILQKEGMSVVQVRSSFRQRQIANGFIQSQLDESREELEELFPGDRELQAKHVMKKLRQAAGIEFFVSDVETIQSKESSLKNTLLNIALPTSEDGRLLLQMQNASVWAKVFYLTESGAIHARDAELIAINHLSPIVVQADEIRLEEFERADFESDQWKQKRVTSVRASGNVRYHQSDELGGKHTVDVSADELFWKVPQQEILLSNEGRVMSITQSEDRKVPLDARFDKYIPGPAVNDIPAVTQQPPKKLEVVLNDICELEFPGNSLTEVIVDINRRYLNGRIKIDHEGLKAAGISPNSEVELVLSGITLRSAMKLILEPLKLGTVVDGDRLIVTSEEKAARWQVKRPYDVSTILSVDEFFADTQQKLNEVNRAELLCEFLSRAVQPHLWDQYGGTARMESLPAEGSIAVFARQSIHSEVSEVVDVLNRSRTGEWSGDSLERLVQLSPQVSGMDHPLAHYLTRQAFKAKASLTLGLENSQYARIRHALEKKVSIDVQRLPFSKFVEKIAAENGINIVVDEKDLQDSRFQIDSPVSIHMENVPLETVLKTVLGQFDLDFELADEVLTFRRAETIANRPVVRVYDIPIQKSQAEEAPFNAEQFEDLVRSTIAPDSWSQVGGGGMIQVIADEEQLIVRNTLTVQQEIEELLQQLNRLLNPNIPEGGIEFKGGMTASSMVVNDLMLANPDEPGALYLLANEITDHVATKSWKVNGDNGSINVDPQKQMLIVRNHRGVIQDVSQFLKRKQERKREEIIAKKLHQPISVKLDNRPMAELFQQISKSLAIGNVIIDEVGLNEEGLTSESPVTIDLQNVAADTLLKVVLSEFNLAYEIEGSKLKITSKDRVDGKLIAMVYQVADLVVERSNISNNTALPPDRLKELEDVISNLIAIDSWEKHGGMGSIQQHQETLSLVIRQTEAVHQKIQALLTLLRNVRNGEEVPLPQFESDPTPKNMLLQQLLTINVKRLPLALLLETLSDQTRLQFFISPNGLAEAGLTEDSEVCAEFDGVFVHEILQKSLSAIGLGYSVHGNLIVVTSTERAAPHMRTMIYSLNNYPEHVSEAHATIKNALETSDQLWGFPSFKGGYYFDSASNSFVFRRTDKVHAHIAKYFESLRKE